jgi:diacylglycerol kinase
MLRLWMRFRYAFSGILAAWRTQPNLRLLAAIALPLIAVCFFLDLDRTQWALIASAIAAIAIAELLNSAIEDTVNLVTAEQHPLAGRAKDMAAGAVLVAIIYAVTIALLVLAPEFWAAIQE